MKYCRSHATLTGSGDRDEHHLRLPTSTRLEESQPESVSVRGVGVRKIWKLVLEESGLFNINPARCRKN